MLYSYYVAFTWWQGPPNEYVGILALSEDLPTLGRFRLEGLGATFRLIDEILRTLCPL